MTDDKPSAKNLELLGGFEDPVDRCGWMVASSDWIWRLLYALRLTKHKQDPYIDACVYHDRWTSKGSWVEEHMSFDYMQDAFDMMIDNAAQRTRHKWVGWLYKKIARNLTPYFWEGTKHE
jgi:hypothetical protein